MGVRVDEVGAGLWLMVVSWGSAVVAVVVAGGVGASDDEVMVGEHGVGDVWAYVVLSVVMFVGRMWRWWRGCCS